MPVIVTLTLNPALDANTSVQEMLPEKKLKCSDPGYEPGGGGINVARAIRKLGGDAVAVYLAGGDTGKKITELLAAEGVNSIAVSTKCASRQNLIVTDQSSNGQYLFDMPGPDISEAEQAACLDVIEEMPEIDYLVVSGSLPRGVPPEIFVQIAKIANSKNARLVVDTAGDALQQAVRAGAYLIKPNLKELCTLAGLEILTAESAADAARQVLQESACEVIVVSLGKKGALLVTKSLSVEIKSPDITALSTVGAGDSLVGGLVFSLSQGKKLEDAVRYGVACGTSATISPGTELCRKTDADRLFQMMSDYA